MASDGDLNLSRFITRVREIPVLSREEEHELALRVRDENDPRAAERLIRANIRYVVAIAVTFRRYDLRLSDLISEGNVGLVTAVRKFDPDAGTRFVTYAAYWIRAFILNHVIRTWSLVGSGSGALRSKVFFRLRRERAKLGATQEEAEAARAELARQMGTTPERVAEMMQRLDGRDVSLDADVYGDGKTAAVDLLEDNTAPQDERFDAAVRQRTLSGGVSAALAGLDRRERYIVEQRMMVDEALSLAELGRRLGVSRERARQLEARAKNKLRKSLGSLAAADAPDTA